MAILLSSAAPPSLPAQGSSAAMLEKQRHMLSAALREPGCDQPAKQANGTDDPDITVCARASGESPHRLGPIVADRPIAARDNVMAQRQSLLDVDKCNPTSSHLRLDCQAGIAIMPMMKALIDKISGD